MLPGRVAFVGIGMIKEIDRACCLFVSDSVAVLTAAFLAPVRAQAAPARAEAAAPTASRPRSAPRPVRGGAGSALAGGLLVSLEAGHPVTSLRTLVPAGVLGR